MATGDSEEFAYIMERCEKLEKQHGIRIESASEPKPTAPDQNKAFDYVFTVGFTSPRKFTSRVQALRWGEQVAEVLTKAMLK